MFNIDTRLKKVDSHLQNGDDNQAISILENIFVKYPKNIRIIEKLKQVSYNKGLCKFREDPKLLGEVNHVLALIEEKQFQLAYNESRKILEDDSNNAIILKVAAKADYEIGNLDQSIDFYYLYLT